MLQFPIPRVHIVDPINPTVWFVVI